MRSFFFFLELVIKKRLWLFEGRNVISKSVYVLCSHSQFFFFSAFRESSLCFFCSFSFSSWDSQRIISWLLHDCNHRSSVLDVISFIERVCVFFFFFFILNLFLRVPNIATVSEIAFKRSVCVCVCVSAGLAKSLRATYTFTLSSFFFFIGHKAENNEKGTRRKKKGKHWFAAKRKSNLTCPLVSFFFFF